MSRATAFANDALVRREEAALSRVVQRELVQLRRRLAELVNELSLIEVSPGRQPRRYAALVDRADALIREAYVRLNATVKSELVALGQRHGARATAQLAQLAQLDTVQLALPTRGMLRSILTTDPVQGNVMSTWWREQARTTQRAFRTQMRLGMVRQEGVPDLVKRIRGVKAPTGGYVGGIMPASTRGATALARTAVTEITNQAALSAYAQDPAISEEYEFVATLDDRTTDECQAADGETFRYDDPKKLVPPLHWNCRSTIVPVIKYAELGLKEPPQERLLYKDWLAQQ